LEIKAADGLKPHWRKMAKLQVGEGVAGLAVAEGRTIYLPDTHRDPSFIFFDKEVRSLLVVPLAARNKIIGTINVDDKEANAFDYAQERLLTIAAAQAGIMIENAQLFAKISAEQEQMQTIIQNMADGVLLIDNHGTIITCNATLAMMLDMHPGQIINQNINTSQLHPNLASITATTTQRARTGVLVREVNIETPRPRTLQVFSTVTFDDRKNSVGEVRLVHDVTRERQLEQLKDDFFSTISHDLRTPLFSIHGFAQLMLEEDDLDRPTQKEFLTTIQRQAQQLGEMVDNLLDLSKLDAGKLEFEKTSLSLLDLIHQTLLKLQGFAHQQEVKLTPNLPAQLPAIDGDAQRLEQVLTNLIGNAIKFSPAGSQVVVSAVAMNSRILVQIKDEGVGISAEELDQIFSRYYQASGSKRTMKGSGLGLHIAKKIVEEHGGQIWAESNIGQGSTFSFTLPLFH
jgi:PAS domain S-box-containing protein